MRLAYLIETDTVTPFELTENQKRVLCKVFISPTPTLALEEISDDTHLISARDMMVEKGFLDINETEASLTDDGKELMLDHNLINNNDELTEDGKFYAGSDSSGDNEEGPVEPEPPTYESFKTITLLRSLFEDYLE